MTARRTLTTLIALCALVPAGATTAAGVSARKPAPAPPGKLMGGFTNLVVIYQENHSFDNLYGGWGRAGNRRVDGIDRAAKSRTVQVDQSGTPYACLPQNDVNLTSGPLAGSCSDPAHAIISAFTNWPYRLDTYIAAEDRTCPAPGASAPNGVLKNSPGALPGGCTRDLVHRFYQEQYQLNGGKQNRYVTGSDALGLTMGVYDTTKLPIYRFLHSPEAPNYVLADRFFQAAFGGSFLNHQYLIAARAPYDASNGGLGAANTVLDANGMPTSYPRYTATTKGVADKQLTVTCPDGAVLDYTKACGNIAVNTVQPSYAPFGGGAKIAPVDSATYPTIGDRLSEKNISWAWYSGGWAEAEAGRPGPLFQYHHQPFNYFTNYAPGQPGRAHLKDETEFLSAAAGGTLPTVSFVKPYGAENEHPGYASEADGSDHLVNLVKAVTNGPQADRTLVVITYDEFGGQWDHVSPPGQGTSTPGYHDAWGPGTRIPALLISKALKRTTVDHTVYDTTSILATIERSFGLAPLSSRDANVNDLGKAIAAGHVRITPRARR